MSKRKVLWRGISFSLEILFLPRIFMAFFPTEEDV